MSLVTTLYRFLVRGGTAANLASVNEVPLARELIVETDTGKTKLGNGTGTFSALPYMGTRNVVTKTADYTLTLADANTYFRMNSASANALTIPPNSSVALPIGTCQWIEQQGAGSTTVTAGAGVTFLNAASPSAQYAVVAYVKTASDTWTCQPASSLADGSVTTAKLADDAATNAKLANMAAGKIKARKTASTGDPEDCSLSEVIDANLSTPANGDILIRTGGAWTRLPPGTDGQALILASGIPGWGTVSGGGGGGAMTWVATATVAGAAATNITISGLDLATDVCYFAVISGTNATASAVQMNLFYNSDTTATNYYRQAVVGASTVVSANRANTGQLFDVAASTAFSGSFTIRADGSGRPRAVSQINRDAAASIALQFDAHIWNSTSNPTSLTLNTSVASAFAVGTVIHLYKIKP